MASLGGGATPSTPLAPTALALPGSTVRIPALCSRASARRTPTVAFSNTVSLREDGQRSEGACWRSEGSTVRGRDIELGVSYPSWPELFPRARKFGRNRNRRIASLQGLDALA